MKKIIKSGIFKTFVIITCLFMSLSSLMIGLNFCGIIYMESGDAFNSSDSYTTIGEIWDSSHSKFIKGTLDSLLQAISGRQATSSNMKKLEDMTPDFFENGLTSSTLKTNNSNREIVVTIGGLKWTPTYLSRDMDDNIILTLWLTDSKQIGNELFAPGKTFDSLGRATWNSGYTPSGDTSTAPYPEDMYGTSYMRSVVLNNGGYYKTYTRDTSLTLATKYALSVFETFTMGSFRKYIVTPYNVSWQYEECAKDIFHCTYNLPNESLSTLNTGFERGHDYTGIEHYTDWGDDFLWLPSYTEIGDGNINGIWGTSVEQRRNYDDTGLRSGYDYEAATLMTSNGFYVDALYVESVYGVRPAFHLNLSLAAASALTINELWDSSSSEFDLNNVNTLLRTISGNSSASITNTAPVDDLANKKTTAADINKETKILVTIGGLNWTPTFLSKDKNKNTILTLWLDNPSQLYGLYGNSPYFIFSGGLAPWSQYPGTSTLVNYPANMYGTSFMRSVVLNNGGQYATSDTTTISYAQFSDSVFAPFTMGDLTKYIVTPQDVSWQESDQSAKTYWGETYNYPNEDLTTSTDFCLFNTFGRPPQTVADLNYTSKTGYTAWGKDYLWLPSAFEIGRLNDDTQAGLWQVTFMQRHQINESWLRSGGEGGMENAQCNISLLMGTGTYIMTKQLATTTTLYNYSVRPAFHLNLTAVCESLNTYNITFSGNGGKVNGRTSINHSGYGYHKNEDLTVYADQDSIQDSATTLYLYRAGYKFLGFTTNSSSPSTTNKLYEVKDGKFTIPNLGNGGTLTLYAQWEARSYSITFDSGGKTLTEGTLPSSVTLNYDDTGTTKYTIPPAKSNIPKTQGYEFSGWKNESNKKIYQPEQQVAIKDLFNISTQSGVYNISNITLTAEWTPITYKVKFDLNTIDIRNEKLFTTPTGSPSITDMSSSNLTPSNGIYTLTYDQLYLVENNFVCNGYHLLGFRTNAGATVTLYGFWSNLSNLTDEKDQEITLYAQWEPTWSKFAHKESAKPVQQGATYLIQSAENLGWLMGTISFGSAELKNSINSTMYTFKQTRNIYLTDYPWNPDGIFSSRYDGNGCYIYDLHNETEENKGIISKDYQGLFAQTSGASLQKITIMSGNIFGANYVGSIVGYATNTLIKNCINYASVSGDACVGGIVGYKTDDLSNASATISSCINYGKVICTSPGELFSSKDTGGIVGHIENGIIKSCYVKATITSIYDIILGSVYFGGIAGNATNTTIEQCAYIGTIKQTGYSNGICATGDGEVKDCLVRTSTSGLDLFPDYENNYIYSTNCIGYVNNGSPQTTAEMDYTNWTTINGQWFPKGLTWLA